jgi:hypothetical protein
MEPARCDRTIFDDGSPKVCAAMVAFGAPMWIETHAYLSPNDAHRSYAVITCEHCRLREIAHEWADACEIPTHKVAQGSMRALAGKHALTAEQYSKAVALTEQIERARARGAKPPVALPDGHRDEGELVVREQRKVRSTRDSRGQLAG